MLPRPPHGAILPKVGSPRLILIASVIAAFAGCSRPGGEVSDAASSRTRAFLQEVGVVRSQINADSAARIPELIRSQDSAQLTDQVARLGQYRHALGQLDPAGVAPGAVKFEQGVEASLEAYRSACLDAAEFFRELKDADARQPGIVKALGEALRPAEGGTLGALDSLVAAANDLDPTLVAGVNLSPVVAAIRADRRRLDLAIDAEQALAKEVASIATP